MARRQVKGIYIRSGITENTFVHVIEIITTIISSFN